MLTLIYKIVCAIDASCHTISLFLDFSKAFDTIDHKIPLNKLSRHRQIFPYDWYFPGLFQGLRDD